MTFDQLAANLLNHALENPRRVIGAVALDLIEEESPLDDTFAPHPNLKVHVLLALDHLLKFIRLSAREQLAAAVEPHEAFQRRIPFWVGRNLRERRQHVETKIEIELEKNTVLIAHLHYPAFSGVIASSYFLIDIEIVGRHGLEP